MIVFFKCVAEAVAEKGVRGVAEMVPGGGVMFDIAKATWERYRQRCKEAKQREEILQLAQATQDEAKQAAVEAVKEIAAQQPEIAPILELFLTQIPASIRQSLKRADDPTGTTVPATFALRGPEDVAKLLPPALPRFKPGDPLPGKAGWLLEKQLGIGGFGEVWLARKSGYESLLGAVKFCRSLDTRDRDLLHESKVIDQLLKHGDHPNIVKLMDVHLEGDAPWLMYEYVEGGDLTDLIHQWSALPPSERQQKALAALQELAAAIGHFHRLDPAIVHRDLKPANILRDKSGRLRITDFGISGVAAKHMIENETRGVTTRAGRLQSYLYGSYTPLYASPQQKDGEAPDPRDDVHALGVIGYQMLTGQVGRGVGSDFAQDLKEAEVPRELIKLLGFCTAAKADRRPQDAKKVLRLIASIATDKAAKKPVPVPPGTAPIPSKTPKPRPPVEAEAKPALIAKEKENLQGTWAFTMVSESGRQGAGASGHGAKLIVQGDKYLYAHGGNTWTANYNVDPSKDPKVLNVEFEEGPARGRPMLGVYLLEGDELWICFGENKRPAGFIPQEGSGEILFVLSREKTGQRRGDSGDGVIKKLWNALFS